MLAIDIAFFLIELISGFMVHSLALMADAFHMLNDIISLIIGLWAVSVAKKETTDKYSYGFVRAEILGAFFNAVFLIALCISIILEALTRFVEPQEVSNPKLILIVGCCGLASNFVGFLVLGGHGHDHGHGHGHGDDHDHAVHDDEHADGHSHPHEHDNITAAEEGRSRSLEDAIADEDGPAMDVLPHVALARARIGSGSTDTMRHIQFNGQDRTQRHSLSAQSASRGSLSRGRGRRRTNSVKHSRFTSIDDLSIHPASFRQDIIDQSNSRDDDNDSNEETSGSSVGEAEESAVDENSPLIIRGGNTGAHGTISSGTGHDSHTHTPHRSRRDSGVHTEHNHNKTKSKSHKGGHSHGHSHGDMGMNAMVLHVLGDALGNVGVIATALIIWLTEWSGKLYADPAVSLFITLIILRSAIPLTRATSKVLLQATPDHLELSEIREDIQNLPGVVSCHHVHVWQLSDTKLGASMHIQVSFPITDEGGERYMKLAKQARKCLHAYGIHSATIQPEFCVDETCRHSSSGGDDGAGTGTATTLTNSLDGGQDTPRCGAKTAISADGDAACLLECVDDCVGLGCCAPAPGSAPTNKAASSRRSSSTAHDHDHDHDHGGSGGGGHGHEGHSH